MCVQMLAHSLRYCISECQRGSYMCIAETCALYVLPNDEVSDVEQQHQTAELNHLQTIFSSFPQVPVHNVSSVEFKLRCVENMLEKTLHTIRDMKLQLQQTAIYISDLRSVAATTDQTATVARRVSI